MKPLCTPGGFSGASTCRQVLLRLLPEDPPDLLLPTRRKHSQAEHVADAAKPTFRGAPGRSFGTHSFESLLEQPQSQKQAIDAFHGKL